MTDRDEPVRAAFVVLRPLVYELARTWVLRHEAEHLWRCFQPLEAAMAEAKLNHGYLFAHSYAMVEYYEERPRPALAALLVAAREFRDCCGRAYGVPTELIEGYPQRVEQRLKRHTARVRRRNGRRV